VCEGETGRELPGIRGGERLDGDGQRGRAGGPIGDLRHWRAQKPISETQPAAGSARHD
jgi:hypothetical protein